MGESRGRTGAPHNFYFPFFFFLFVLKYSSNSAHTICSLLQTDLFFYVHFALGKGQKRDHNNGFVQFFGFKHRKKAGIVYPSHALHLQPPHNLCQRSGLLPYALKMHCHEKIMSTYRCSSFLSYSTTLKVMALTLPVCIWQGTEDCCLDVFVASIGSLFPI